MYLRFIHVVDQNNNNNNNNNDNNNNYNKCDYLQYITCSNMLQNSQAKFMYNVKNHVM